jgi:hypothetical protein
METRNGYHRYHHRLLSFSRKSPGLVGLQRPLRLKTAIPAIPALRILGWFRPV